MSTKKIISDLSSLLKTHNRIGLFMSGGMDSSLLSCMLHYARVFDGLHNTFEVFVVPRTDDSVVHATRVVKYIDSLFNEYPTKIHVLGDPTLHHSKQVISGILAALDAHKNIDVFLNAANITPEDVPDGPIRFQSKNPKVLLPFFDYTKDVLVQTYIDMGLTELMKMTHTCTESKLLRCSECWQCKERAWAFKQCNYTDPGTM